MQKLTAAHVKAMEPDEIFLTGTLPDSPMGINMTGSGKMLRFVACRGGAPDWAIYVYWDTHDEEYVKRHGDKVKSLDLVARIVPCDESALAVYRR